jgi:hypothetical protein
MVDKNKIMGQIMNDLYYAFYPKYTSLLSKEDINTVLVSFINGILLERTLGHADNMKETINKIKNAKEQKDSIHKIAFETMWFMIRLMENQILLNHKQHVSISQALTDILTKKEYIDLCNKEKPMDLDLGEFEFELN